MAATIAESREDAMLYRRLATLDLDAPVMGGVDELRWIGPRDHLADMCKHLDASRLAQRAVRLAEGRA